LAGVTLLAFGGGAPDVFSSLSAAQGGEVEGIEMGIAVLLGSSLFIFAVIGGMVIYYSPQAIQMNKSYFLRDTFFLMLGLVLLLYAIVLHGVIDMTMSIAFISLYTVYVFAVFYQDRYMYNEQSDEMAQKAAAQANM